MTSEVSSARDERRLRILVVSPSLPYPAGWGFARRVLHLVEHLAARHSVTMLSFVGPEVTDEHIRVYGERVDRLVTVPLPDPRHRARRLRQAASMLSLTPYHAREVTSAGLQSAFDDLVAQERFDVVLLETSCLGTLRIPADLPVVVDEHNVESDLLDRMARTEAGALRRAFNKWECLRFRRFEDQVWARVTACTATSAQDAGAIEARAGGLPVVVVANGVDPDEFRPAADDGVTADSLVFAGLLTYRPNIDGLTWFLEEVFPEIRARRPGCTLTVVGSGSPEQLAALSSPGVTCTGFVPDVKPPVREAAVSVVPLRMGGGTRLKVLEAMAMGKAIVSTRIGAEGIDVVSGVHLELRDDPVDFAEAVVELLDSPQRRRELGTAARDLLEQRYSWARAGGLLEDVLRQASAPGVPVGTGERPASARR